MPLANKIQINSDSASALSNLATLYLSGALEGKMPSVQSLRIGIDFKLKYLESFYRYDFVGFNNSDTLEFNKNQLQLLFLWTLLREGVASGLVSYEQFVSIVLECTFSAKQVFIGEVIKDIAEMEDILGD